MSTNNANPTQTVESKTAVEYLNADREPEPSSMTGPGTHFQNTFDPALKKDAPQLPDTSIAPQPASAKEKLAETNSTMTTAQLQKAAQEGDPNGLTGATAVRKEKQQEGDAEGWSGRY